MREKGEPLAEQGRGRLVPGKHLRPKTCGDEPSPPLANLLLGFYRDPLLFMGAFVKGLHRHDAGGSFGRFDQRLIL